MFRFTVLLICIVAPSASSKSVKQSTCGPVCAIYCQYGHVLDENGCPTCSCNEHPTCGPVCEIYCQYGHVLDENGCPTCACNKSPCKDGRAPLINYFCGRGPNRKDCPSTHDCIISPVDAYAVCCPCDEQPATKVVKTTLKTTLKTTMKTTLKTTMKPGSCPSSSDKPSVDAANCSTDNDCKGNLKCCGNDPRKCVTPSL